MFDQARTAATGDEIVRSMLAARVDDAFRLATFILRDRVAAEDAVQEAALLAWRRRASLRDPAAADGWFTRIVVNVCRDELRRRPARARVITLEPAVAGLADAGMPPDRPDALGPALARLSPDEQSLLALRYGRDLTVPQVAAALAIPEGTAKSRLHAALQHLRAALDAEERLEAAR